MLPSQGMRPTFPSAVISKGLGHLSLSLDLRAGSSLFVIRTSSIMLPKQVAGAILLKGTESERQVSSYDFRDQRFQIPQVVRIERREGITPAPYSPHVR